MQLTSKVIAKYTMDCSIRDFDADVTTQAGRFVLDSLGCCVGAYGSPPVERLRATYSPRTTTDADATIFGDGAAVPPEYAALVNGAMVRYLDYNDCYISGTSVCHPSDHVPALVSVAEAEGASGADLVEALVLAYEVMCRGVDTGLAWERGFDYVMWGAYSGVAGVGKLMDLSRAELIDALGIAGASSNALLASRLGDVSMWKGIAQSYALHNAVQACQMARSGITGPPHVFEGEGGFVETVTGEPVNVSGLGGRNGESYRLTRSNIKPYACGYFMMAPISATLQLLDEHDIDSAAIDGIEIRTFDQAVQVLSGPEKRSAELNRETADHSLPYSISVAVVDGNVTPRQYRNDRLSDERVHALMERVSVTADDSLTDHRRENPGEIPSKVVIAADGETYERQVNTPPGHFRNRLSNERIEAKVHDLTASFLTTERTNRLIALCHDVADLDSVDEIVDCLTV